MSAMRRDAGTIDTSWDRDSAIAALRFSLLLPCACRPHTQVIASGACVLVVHPHGWRRGREARAPRHGKCVHVCVCCARVCMCACLCMHACVCVCAREERAMEDAWACPH